jgi:predicted ATP-dependent serine protease
MNQKIKKALSYADIQKVNFKSITIDADWKQHFGEPQLGNSHWLIFGDSGHGKTSYALQVVKQLCANGHKVHYDTLEEGTKLSFKKALERNNMKVANGFNYQKETLPELTARLNRKRQPKIIVIDSVQYFFRGKSEKHYFEFISQFEDTTFIWISGAEGKKPRGKVAEAIKYDADIIVFVENYLAKIEKNRFEAYQPRIIWEQGYNDNQLKLKQ